MALTTALCVSIGCNSPPHASQAGRLQERGSLVRSGRLAETELPAIITLIISRSRLNCSPALTNAPINDEPPSSPAIENGRVSRAPLEPIAPQVPQIYVVNILGEKPVCPVCAGGGEPDDSVRPPTPHPERPATNMITLVIAILALAIGLCMYLLALVVALVGREQRKKWFAKRQERGNGLADARPAKTIEGGIEGVVTRAVEYALAAEQERIATGALGKVREELAKKSEELKKRVTDTKEQYDELAKKYEELESKAAGMRSELERALNSNRKLTRWIEASRLQRDFSEVEDSDKSTPMFWREN